MNHDRTPDREHGCTGSYMTANPSSTFLTDPLHVHDHVVPSSLTEAASSAPLGESWKPQLFAASSGCQFCARADAELAIDPRQRRFDGVLGHEQGGRHLAVRVALRDEPGDPLLCLRQLTVATARGRRCGRARRGPVRPRAVRPGARIGRARPRGLRGRRARASRAAASDRVRVASARGETDRWLRACSRERALEARERCRRDLPARRATARGNGPGSPAPRPGRRARARGSQVSRISPASSSSPTAINASSRSPSSSRCAGLEHERVAELVRTSSGATTAAPGRRATARRSRAPSCEPDCAMRIPMASPPADLAASGGARLVDPAPVRGDHRGREHVGGYHAPELRSEIANESAANLGRRRPSSRLATRASPSHQVTVASPSGSLRARCSPSSR